MTSSTFGRVGLLWLRRDLRLYDHPALAAALGAADAVVPVYVLDPRLLDGPRSSANRTWFLLATLRALAADLAARGAPLVVRTGRPEEVIPALAAEGGAGDVFATRDVSPFARARDRAVADTLSADGRRLHLQRGLLVAEPEDVHTEDGRPVTVFTPFSRRWAAAPRRALLAAPSAIRSLPAGTLAGETIPEGPAPTADPTLLPVPGEAAARDRLARWVASAALPAYADGRNRLDANGTSRLSADLKFGALSPLEVLLAVEGQGEGRRVFVSELCWREFYLHVLWHFPHVARGAFRPAYDAVPWADDPAGLAAWREGRTGYPVVDAAMRQLAASGWMHNRARMIAASFLTKDLLIDWRRGEEHFMQHLVDGDVASNNGGWQWTAGTGTDAAPYFRVFNPASQGRRFDPEGAYVRRWVPELERVPVGHVHEPWTMPPDVQDAAGCVIGRDYAAPLVDHAFARDRALAAYAAARR
ncbi:MAG TPA: deoxyribodipyrimidine photo-lyase [Candidatus Nanopelagicales bacterium]|nr:deoxyribodipyrimidine photo-lyase [Candidatus Nanopelagicales bacterium]